jgi:DNA-directed RNA polymerase subunit H (RpoH/RPB5)
MTDHKKILEIYKSRNNLLDILESINYNVSDYKGFSISEIDTLVRNKQLDMLVTNKDNEKKNYIKYFIEKSLRPQNLHDMIDDLFNIEEILDKKDNLIIIIKDEPNETIQKLLSELFVNDGHFVIVINIQRLQFNILNHSMVPKHNILDSKEKDLVIKEFNIQDDNIPNISRFDPVAQVIGIRPGEYCEIIRPSKTSITSKYYRICSN